MERTAEALRYALAHEMRRGATDFYDSETSGCASGKCLRQGQLVSMDCSRICAEYTASYLQYTYCLYSTHCVAWRGTLTIIRAIEKQKTRMHAQSRGFGQEHHSTTDSPIMTKTDEYQHIASILSIIITGITLIGTICIIIRTLLALRRPTGDSKNGNGSDQVAEQDEEVGGAKRTRAKLCIALLISDAWVGISWLAPAAMDLKDTPLRGDHCQAPGTTLATALWWQYGFSIAIAASTFFAIRHPLSSFKYWQERKVGVLICGIVILGAVQAVLWKQLHGFTNWGQFCYYGSPHSRLAEVTQFFPRLLSSFIIAIVYAYLIHFLRRPDLTARCSPSPQFRNNSAETLCEVHQVNTEGAKDVDDRPPWEKIHLPDFSRLVQEEMEKAPTRGIKARLSTPDRVWLKGSTIPRHGRSASNVSELTLVATPRSLGTAAGSVHSLITGTLTPTPPLQPPQLPRNRPSTAPSKMPSPPQPAFVSMQATLSLPIEIERELSRGSLAPTEDTREISSFRGMLLGPDTDSDSLAQRPGTPALNDQGRIESRADVLNRQTWKLLVWFPMTVRPKQLMVSRPTSDNRSMYSFSALHCMSRQDLHGIRADWLLDSAWSGSPSKKAQTISILRVGEWTS